MVRLRLFDALNAVENLRHFELFALPGGTFRGFTTSTCLPQWPLMLLGPLVMHARCVVRLSPNSELIQDYHADAVAHYSLLGLLLMAKSLVFLLLFSDKKLTSRSLLPDSKVAEEAEAKAQIG